MRGALTVEQVEVAQRGIIPADAGSTISTASLTLSDGDHPRGCGEHEFLQEIYTGGGGSSPRMRGAQTDSRYDGCRPGDHPRGCGEHLT